LPNTSICVMRLLVLPLALKSILTSVLTIKSFTESERTCSVHDKVQPTIITEFTTPVRNHRAKSKTNRRENTLRKHWKLSNSRDTSYYRKNRNVGFLRENKMVDTQIQGLWLKGMVDAYHHLTLTYEKLVYRFHDGQKKRRCKRAEVGAQRDCTAQRCRGARFGSPLGFSSSHPSLFRTFKTSPVPNPGVIRGQPRNLDSDQLSSTSLTHRRQVDILMHQKNMVGVISLPWFHRIPLPKKRRRSRRARSCESLVWLSKLVWDARWTMLGGSEAGCQHTTNHA
jgi:hypothetical protein